MMLVTWCRAALTDTVMLMARGPEGVRLPTDNEQDLYLCQFVPVRLSSNR